MNQRWHLIYVAKCKGAIVIWGSGSVAADGTYCPDGLENGAPVWTKIGGTRLEDSIYTPLDPSDPPNTLPYGVLTSGGRYEDDPNNALYGNFTMPPISALDPWFVHDAFGGGGALPVPQSVFWPEKENVIRLLDPITPDKFTEEEDLSLALIALRTKLTTSLVFKGADFDYFRAIERNPDRRCEEFIVRRQWLCEGRWKTLWYGTFSAGSGQWDLDNCLFTVRPEVLDRYTCLMSGLNKKFNALAVVPVDASAQASPSLEWGGYIAYFGNTPGQPCNRGYLVTFDPGNEPIDDSFGGTPNGEWTLAQTIVLGGVAYIYAYVRERLRTYCVGGLPVPPIGAGWVLLTNDCAVDGTAVYVRVPPFAITVGTISAGTCVDGAAVPPMASGSCQWLLVLPCATGDCAGVTIDTLAYYLCYTPTVTAFPRARLMMEVLKYGLDQAGCGIPSVVSDFFEYNPAGNAPGYAPGINYVTGAANEVNNLVLLRNSDAEDPAASNPATLGELTLKELLLFFMVEFQVFWDIDDDGNLRLEHWIYWTFPVGLDLFNYAEEDKSEPLSYVYLNAEIPRYERLRNQYAQNTDFVGADIVNSGPCVTTVESAELKEYNAGPFTTDITMIIVEPDPIGPGFTVLATAYDGAVYNTIVGTGALSGNSVSNAPLSVANVQRDYWTWNRFLFNGNMNRKDVVFDGIQPNIEQVNVVVKMCCDVFGFNARHRVRSLLGSKLGGRTASIRRDDIDDATGSVTLTLRYSY